MAELLLEFTALCGVKAVQPLWQLLRQLQFAGYPHLPLTSSR